MHAGYVLGQFVEWQRQLKAHSDTPITVESTLSALSQWSSYYAQQQLSPYCSYYKQQQYAARVPQLEHLIKELECVSATCDSDCTTTNCSDRTVLSKWSAAVTGTSQQAHARLQQIARGRGEVNSQCRVAAERIITVHHQSTVEAPPLSLGMTTPVAAAVAATSQTTATAVEAAAAAAAA
eukprot:50-Heterococcus_DN1.PRE.1